MIFEITTDLPLSTQREIERISLIPSAQRNTKDAEFIAAWNVLINNERLFIDQDDLILLAAGNVLPTSYSGFRKGALFIKKDATGKSLYENTGSSTTATWDLLGEVNASDIADNSVTNDKLANPLTLEGISLFDDTAPVNAVAASKLLTIGTNPINQATVSLGGVPYRFMSVLGNGVAATGTLTFNSELPHDGNTVILGSQTYIFKTALSAGPTVPNEILIEATVTLTIDNLVSALEGTAGEGTKYSVGTLSQGMITTSKASADTFLVTYDSVGFLGNQYDTLGTLTHATWGANTLTGGIDAQAANDVLIGNDTQASIDNLVLAITAGADTSKYGTGTVVNPLATAVKASASTMTATNKIKGIIGNSTAIAETLADGSWASGALFLTGGTDGTVGVKNEIRLDATNMYLCTAVNTIAGANWKKLVLQSL